MTLRVTARTLSAEKHGYDLPTEETLLSMAHDALERPSDSGWHDSELWETHTLMFSTPDWSLTDDYPIDQANYRDALEILSTAYPRSAESATFGHWTYSRFECVRVRVCYTSGEITPAFALACALIESMRDYPLLSDETHSELLREISDSNFEWSWNEAVNDPAYYRKDLSEIELERIADLSDEDTARAQSEFWERVSSGTIEPGYGDNGAETFDPAEIIPIILLVSDPERPYYTRRELEDTPHIF